MLARRTTPFSRWCSFLPRVCLPGACLTGVSFLLTSCGTQDSKARQQTSESRPLWFFNKKNPKFEAGLNYLDGSLKDSSVVGDETSRKGRWRLHWDPGRCTNPRGSELEITPGLQEFNSKNAYWLSWLSIQAYRKGSDALTHLAKVGFTNVDLINEQNSGFQAFVGSTETYAVVSFAGTSEWIDYLTDLTFASKPETMRGIPGQVHIGFLNVLDRSWPKLIELVQKHAAGGKPILLTGHSMGGAQAVMSAVRLSQMGFPVDQIYIFAVPRLGDEAYARFVEKILPNRIWRFVNNEDLVPRLPPPPVAADAFSRVFPGDSREAIKAVFEALQYKHIGKLLIQNGRGGLSEPRVYSEEEDVDYWNKVFERTQGRNIPQAVFANWRMLFDHIPFASHCQLNPPKAPAFNRFTDFVD
jgi:triacylglycerol lipase